MEIRINATPEEIVRLMDGIGDHQSPECVLIRKPYTSEYVLTDISELQGNSSKHR